MISIIVPCFHAERFLERLVENVKSQSYVDWELLIVSNGKGQEKQLEIANRLSASDYRIIVIHTDEGGYQMPEISASKRQKENGYVSWMQTMKSALTIWMFSPVKLHQV